MYERRISKLMKVNFWIVIAVLYFVLAMASLLASKRHSQYLNKVGQHISFKGNPFLRPTLDYLDLVTWINIIAFVLAAIAAVISI